MLTVIAGPSRSGKTAEILNRIDSRCREEKKSILIVPESYSHHAERMLLQRCGNGGGRYAGVATFSKLMRDILEHQGIRDRSLDAGGKVLLMTRAFLSLRPTLTYYRGVLRPRMIDRLLDAVDELIACQVKPHQLLETQGEKEGKLYDLALLYLAYTNLLQDKLQVTGDLFDLACTLIPHCPLYKAAEVFIDGFSGFTAQRYRAIDAFSSCAAVTVTLLMDGEGLHFAQQRKTLGRLERMGKDKGHFLLQHLPTPQNSFRKLGQALFDYSMTQWEGTGLALYEAQDAAEECQLAAAQIRQLTLDGEVRMREIAVVCADLEGYARHLANAFDRYQVPLYLSQPQDILKKPPIIAALGALEAIEEGLSPESVFAWLKLGLVPLSMGELCRLEHYMTLWNIGGSKWYAPFTLATTGYDPEGEGEEERIAALNDSRTLIAGWLEPLHEEVRCAKTGGDYITALRRHFEQTRLEERLEERIAALEGQGQLASEYAQLYDILNTALDQYFAVCGDAPQTLTEFCSLLRLTLSQYRVDTIPVSLDAVQACDFDRLATDRLRHIFILGGREGLLPKPATGTGLITESDRIRLEGQGITLTQSAEERAFEIQSYLYRAFAGAADSVTLSRPRLGEGGEEYSPSYLFSRILQLAPTLPVMQASQGLDTLSLTAYIPAFERACLSARYPLRDSGRAALAYFLPQKGEYLEGLRRYAAAPRGPITDPALVRTIYGDTIRLTASRIERVASCRFSGFMQYGLRAKPIKGARFGAPETGSFVHEIVEKAVRELHETQSQDIAGVVEKYVAEYSKSRLHRREQTARFRATLRNLTKSIVLIVTNVWEEIASSDFKPLFFEMEIGGDNPPLMLEGDNCTLSVTGKIDRVDGYIKDGRLMIKVVDYKTGKKSFKLSDVLYGLNLQMFLYLLMVQNTLSRQDPSAAGALYIPAKAPYIPMENADETEIQADLDKKLRRIGLVLDEVEVLEAMEKTKGGVYRFLPVKIKRDGTPYTDSSIASAAQMGKLLARTQKHLEKLGSLLAAGDIEANPYRKEQDFTSCQWCDYRAACLFDEGMERDKLRFLPGLSNREVFQLLEEEGDGYGH